MYSGTVRGSSVESELDTEPLGAGSTRSPIVARNGFVVGLQSTSTASPRAAGTLDADRRRLAELDIDAEVVGQRRLR